MPMTEAEALARRIASEIAYLWEDQRDDTAVVLLPLCEALLLAREALDAMTIRNGREIGYRTMHEIPMEMAQKIERKVRAALVAIDALLKEKP